MRLAILGVLALTWTLHSIRAAEPPLQLVFEKEHQVRNFFNSSIPLNPLSFSDVARFTVVHHTEPGCAIGCGDGKRVTFTNEAAAVQESLINIGALYPYSAIDLEVETQNHTTYSANAILALYKDTENWVGVVQRAAGAGKSSITMEVFQNGKSVLSEVLRDASCEVPYTLRVHLGGKYVSVFVVKNGKWDYLKTVDIGRQFDLRSKALCANFSVCVGARLAKGETVAFSRAEQFLTCGTGQADPRVLHYENGDPLTEDDTIWVAMTTRGYDPIPASHQGLYRYNIKTHEWTLAGDMTFDQGDGLLRGWHATDIFYDRQDKKWKVLTVSHGDDHRIYFGTCEKDPREGISTIQVKRGQYPSVGNEEDPSIVYDDVAKKWRMGICQSKRGYQTVMLESDQWDGPWKEIARYAPTSSTGLLIQKVEGKRYVFIGRGKANYEVLSYPDLQKLGSLNVSEMLTDNNVWPVIIPVRHGDRTSYHMLTFDRRLTTGKYSYGDLYWYSAKRKQ